MIFGKDEKKRSVIWRIGMGASTIIIVLIAVYFVVQIFTSNPLEGKWNSEYDDMDMTVKSNGEAVIEWSDDTFAVEDVSVVMDYTVDTNTNTFVLHKDESAITNAAGRLNGAVTEDELRSKVENLEGSYEYNIEGEYLTLSEREYGEQMVFEKD